MPAVGDRAEVYLDGGILDGADVVAAVAFGARACLVGRAYLYGLMAGGERGVQRAADLLSREVTRTMQLLGVDVGRRADAGPGAPPLLRSLPAGTCGFLGCSMDVVEVVPSFEQYAFTFGGVAPLRRVAPGTALRLWSEDAFCGALRSVKDLSSEKVDLRFVNPQTGPFYVEGAEPGDTLALHFVALEPARDWGASAAIPFFGGLTSTDRVATLQDPLPDTTWIYELDRARNTVTFAAQHSDLRVDLPVEPMLGHGRRRAAGRRGAQLAGARARSAATWTPRRCGPAPPASSASTSRARCSRSATATTGRARARPAAPPSRAP